MSKLDAALPAAAVVGSRGAVSTGLTCVPVAPNNGNYGSERSGDVV